MKTEKELKIIKVSDDVCVACGRVFDKWGVASIILDTEGMSRGEIERQFVNRFVTQICRQRVIGKGIPNISRGNRWDVKWYDYSDVAKTHIVKENVMEKVLSGKPKIYSIEKREDGSLKVNKVEGELYDEDELKIALCKMALGD